jgi:hypothetical protein
VLAPASVITANCRHQTSPIGFSSRSRPGGWGQVFEPHQGVFIANELGRVRDSHRHTEVADLFAPWDSDPLALLSLPDLGM